MLMLATDLDRTLFPNGRQPYDGSMPRLQRLLERRPDILLVYVTGRNRQETRSGMAEFAAPPPAYAVCEVGTRIYRVENGELQIDQGWADLIAARTAGWDIPEFARVLAGISGLRRQEDDHQNPFKFSLYLDQPQRDDQRVGRIRQLVTKLTPDADVVYSVDETRGIGLVDLLPRAATKAAGLEYLREHYGLSRDDVVYAGDSGNDLLPLTSGCRAILVRNAVDEVRTEALRIMDEQGGADRLYCARGAGDLNGYYVSGLLEGLLHFDLVTAEETA
ncbi:MAG: HAD-IIB family hydrolase [Kiritimatiellia bacterium]|nr:HAD-IIB family hydrolase [Lentisphaerota bacterium]